MAYTKTLRVLERLGWTTKPAPDIPDNRLTAEEVDHNFLQMEDEKVDHVPKSWEAAISYDDDLIDESEYAKGDIVYKQRLNRTGGELDSITYYKSIDGGSNWTEIGTETLVYTGDKLTGTTWADA